MPKILNLRKKPDLPKRIIQRPSEPKEEVKIEPTNKQSKSQYQSVSSPRESVPLEVRPARRAWSADDPDLSRDVLPLTGPKISWEAPLFYYNPQKRYLSLVTAALMAAAIALLVFKYDTLTSIFLILASVVLLLYSKQKPTMSKITIDQSGILVDDIMYYYKDLKSFWIEYNPGGPKELSLESAKWYMPYVKIQLNEQNPVEVRSLVINFVPEKEHENSLVDHIGRKLGL